LKANGWYISGDFEAAKQLLDNGCPQLENAINYEAMGPKWYRVVVMHLNDYAGLDDHNHANQLHTISPSVPPTDHGIPIPHPSHSKSKMQSLQMTPTEGMEQEEEMDGSIIGGPLMDLALEQSEDGTSTCTEKESGTISPTPNSRESSTIVPTHTGQEAGAPPDESTDLTQVGAHYPKRPATGTKVGISLNDNTEAAEQVSCFQEWCWFDPDCKRMSKHGSMMYTHHESKIGNRAILILKHAVNEDLRWCIDARPQITEAVYVLCQAMVCFDSWIGNIVYIARGQGKWKANLEGGRQQQLHKK